MQRHIHITHGVCDDCEIQLKLKTQITTNAMSLSTATYIFKEP